MSMTAEKVCSISPTGHCIPDRIPGNTACGMYADIIDLPYEGSRTRPRMSMHDRAAQFSPFAALTGYEDAIRETARQTEVRMVPDEEELTRLNRKFRELTDCCSARPEVRFICFRADERKAGGAYVTVKGQVRRVSETERQIVLQDGTKLSMDDIVDLEIILRPEDTSPQDSL